MSTSKEPTSPNDAPKPKKSGIFALLTLDIGPLRRHRDYRLLYLGQFVSFAGTMMTYVAVPYQVYRLTGSSFAVGLLGVVQLVPLLATAFIGGALADALDRRRLLLTCEAALAVCSLLLVLNASLPQPHLWAIYVLAALISALSGLHRPSLTALTPQLVSAEDVPRIGPLSALNGSICMIGGPTLGGILIARGGPTLAFSVDAVSFLVSLACLARIRRMPPSEKAERPGLATIVSGLRYAVSRQELIGTYVVDFVAMIFGMPTALFPAMGDHLGGPAVVGYLYAAPSVGALVATLTSGWSSRVRRHGTAILWAAAAWGAAIVAFGFAPTFAWAFAFLVLAGAADMISGVFRSTIWNETIPTELRGRLAAVEMVSYMSGPLLGNTESGLVAAAFGVSVSVISGGALCVVGVGLCAWLLPRFRAYHAGRPPSAT